PSEVAKRCLLALQTKMSQSYDDASVLYMTDSRGVENLLYINLLERLSENDERLLEIYMHNIGLTFENLNLQLDLRE
ncbi:DUF3369 domain-containing protein, partial [Vibrio anguillarum]